MERLFLSRTQNNQIEGPFNQEEVRRRLEQGVLSTNDEISASAGYWFSLHEREEVLRWLGRPLKELGDESDDATATMTVTKTLSMDGGIMEESLMEDGHHDTTPIAAKAAAPIASVTPPKHAPRATLAATPKANSVPVQVSAENYTVEAPSYWKWLVLIFLVLLIFILYRVFGLPQGLLSNFPFRGA